MAQFRRFFPRIDRRVKRELRILWKLLALGMYTYLAFDVAQSLIEKPETKRVAIVVIPTPEDQS
jgi:hypothetical protein